MLAPLAEWQLAAWERIADGWPELAEDKTTVYRCPRCDTGVMLATDRHGKTFLYTHEQRLSAVVLHLRNHHADLDPDRLPGGL